MENKPTENDLKAVISAMFAVTSRPDFRIGEEPERDTSQLESVISTLLSFIDPETAAIVPAVALEDSRWCLPGGPGVAEWFSRKDATHDIACILSNRDGKTVSVISVSDDGAVAGEYLRTKEDFVRYFGSDSWK